jgi:hypothetical protein
MKNIYAIIVTVVLATCAHSATATWTNASTDGNSETPSNWSTASVPGTADDVIITTSDAVGNGAGAQWNIKSITLNSGALNSSIETLGQSVGIGSGGITIGTNSSLSFNLGVVFTANSTISLASNSRAIFASNTFVDSTLVVNANLGSGATLSLSTTSSPWAGTMNFTGAVTPTSIIVTNGSMDSTTLSKITINGLSVIQSNGFIVSVSAIPEPSTFAALFGAAALGMAAYRRRRVTV